MTAGIVLNGEIPHNIECDFLVCADGGYDYLAEQGIVPNILIGDMDSIKSKVNIDIKKYPCEKNETDGELALNYLIDKGFKDIVIYGAFGGRPDHEFGNYCLMYKAFLQGIKVSCRSDKYTAYITDKPFNLKKTKNKTVSLVPFIDWIHINSCKGLKYPMDNLTISKASTIGISNIALEDEIFIDIESGAALIFVIE